MESLLKGRLSDDDSMDSLDDDYDGDEDEEKGGLKFQKLDYEEEVSHSNLLDSIGESLGSRTKLGDRSRKEPSSKIVEYQSLSSEDRGVLPSFRGVKSIRGAKKATKKQLKNSKEIDEQAILDEVYDDPSVTKPVLEKAKRSALYENAKKDVNKWNSVVYHNRVSDQIVYPLGNDTKITKRSIKDSASEFVPQTPLEEEMAKILYGEDYVTRKKNEIHSAGENRTSEEAYMLSVEEALEKHSELARLRAVQSYEMAKAKRRNKIKSKKYHRLLRREKIKKQLKEFEEMKQTDPEGALQKLDILEKSRIRERMTLKHRNTSKWAKMQAARAKYNKDSRIALSDQLKISKELTQKNAESSSSSDDDDSEDEIIEKEKQFKDVQDFIINQDEINFETSGRAPNKPFSLVSVRSFSSPVTTAAPSAPDPAPIIAAKDVKLDTSSFVLINPKAKDVAKNVTVNNEFLNIEDADFDDNGADDDEDQKAVIAEAFEDDDVIGDFQKRKVDEIEASKPKDVNLSLPGWGEWGGKGVHPRKKKPLLLRAHPQPTRKDERLPHVIINEKVKRMLQDHQVRQLPFPFSRVKDYEKIIRAPVGRTWLPEKAMKSLIAPKIITKLGSVIKPINEDVLVKKKPARAIRSF